MTHPYITRDPAILDGAPIFAGTRIAVALIREKLAAGETIESLLLDYPQLTRRAIEAAAQHAGKIVCFWHADTPAPQHPHAPCWVVGIAQQSETTQRWLLWSTVDRFTSEEEAERYAQSVAERCGIAMIHRGPVSDLNRTVE